jgi:hypothetical protein
VTSDDDERSDSFWGSLRKTLLGQTSARKAALWTRDALVPVLSSPRRSYQWERIGHRSAFFLNSPRLERTLPHQEWVLI